jgi:hypothetical protein
VFQNAQSTGIYDVPIDSIISVIDRDGNGTPSMTLLVDKGGLDPVSTIQDYLNIPSTHEVLDKYTEKLNDLNDVSLVNPIEYNLMAFKNGKWTNTTPSDIAGQIKINDISDVNASSPEDNYILSWDDNSNQWVAISLDGGTY